MWMHLFNNHEELCIFLIQQNNLLDVPINSVVFNPDHTWNKIDALQNFANSPQIDELFKLKQELDKKPNFQKLEEGYWKLEPYSPFYYAIKNNMQGNIYLLIQKGFDEFSALSESLIQSKFNLFATLAETVKDGVIKDGVSNENK